MVPVIKSQRFMSLIIISKEINKPKTLNTIMNIYS